MRDPNTTRSRGFGFLTFVDPSVVNTVLVKEHHLDGKIIDPKRAIPREEQEKTEKIFVGGIAPEVTEEEFKEYFSQFGHVIDATLMVDRDSGRPRGFGFITFDSSEPVEKAMSRTDLEINNKQIEVKRAMPKHKSQRVQTMYGHQSYGSSSSTNASPGIMSSPTSSANSRYGSPYAIAGGAKDGNSSVGNYNPSSYPSYGGYGQYSGYNYPSSYPNTEVMAASTEAEVDMDPVVGDLIVSGMGETVVMAPVPPLPVVPQLWVALIPVVVSAVIVIPLVVMKVMVVGIIIITILLPCMVAVVVRAVDLLARLTPAQ
ncbi:3704_t:CDS:2 [Acaulospora colombiana]|uniref:3704_t:CDS:1 n=1 Tax=Acaulospora colombiana TaxID=27376 RepID=A0ACA9LCR5_9GLOM|nr:3704_t:CDS:2 [Acaulospora colombiana]